MIKLTHKPWAKFIAVIVCILSGIVMIASLTGIAIYYREFNSHNLSEKDMEETVYANLSENYAAYMLDRLSGEDFDALDGGNLLYTVIKMPAESSGAYDPSKGEQIGRAHV